MADKLTGFVLALSLLCAVTSAKAEEGKRYNFGTRPHPIVTEAAEPAEDTKPAETATTSEDAPKPAAEAATTEAAATEASPAEPASKLVNGVYSPSQSGGGSKNPAPSPVSPMAAKAKQTEKAEQLVRFFIGSCFKFYGRNDDMVKYMDDLFPRLDTDRKAVFAPVINATVNSQYWDVVRGDNYYILIKDTSSGKCDVIAKDGSSNAVHRELKAVMDGLTITKIVETKTDYEKVSSQNKEVSMVNILGHPLEKELGIVATTQIKETGDNMATILTLFTVPQESVEIKEAQ